MWKTRVAGEEISLSGFSPECLRKKWSYSYQHPRAMCGAKVSSKHGFSPFPLRLSLVLSFYTRQVGELGWDPSIKMRGGQFSVPPWLFTKEQVLLGLFLSGGRSLLWRRKMGGQGVGGWALLRVCCEGGNAGVSLLGEVSVSRSF